MRLSRRLVAGALAAAGLALVAASPALADGWKRHHHGHGGWGNGGYFAFNSGGYYSQPGYYYAQPYYYQPPVYYYPAPVYSAPPPPPVYYQPPPPVYYQPAPIYQGPSFSLVLPFRIH